MSDSTALSPLWRRILNLVGRGRLTAIDDSGPVQVVQVQLGGDELKDDTPNVQHYGFASSPPPGTDVVVVFIAGERTNGAIVATNHQDSRLRNLLVGDVALYDLRGQVVKLSDLGILLDAPVVKVAHSLQVGNGASGTFTTPTGQTVTVQDGIVTNID